MLDTQSLEWLITCERLKDEVAVVEQECQSILGRFEELGRQPTDEERDARRHDYLENRVRLNSLNEEILDLSRRLHARH